MARVLLISTYDQGHQPLGIAAPAAALRSAGHEVSAFDLAVESVSSEHLQSAASEADLIGISPPMHTAARLGVRIARQLEQMSEKIVFYGLAANSLRDLGLGQAISGDTDLQLVALAGGDTASAVPIFDRESRQIPDRSILPGLERYASYRDANGGSHLAGYVEATRGCAHRCTHCPLTPIYAGRLRLNGTDTVLADIDQQVTAGAEHITFGDPDFLNAPDLAMELLRRASRAHPVITFDATIKVEHLLEHAKHIEYFADNHCLFITSAVESIENQVLEELEKGHEAKDFFEALELLRSLGISMLPTFVPFTPWTTIEGYIQLLNEIVRLRLVNCVAPVQLSIRLLLPHGTRLLESEHRQADWLGKFDSQMLGYQWMHPDPLVDELQVRIQDWVMDAEQNGLDRQKIFSGVWKLAHSINGSQPPVLIQGVQPLAPQMSEPWYCCAEPTALQISQISTATIPAV